MGTVNRGTVQTTGRWIGGAARPLMAWLTTPADGPGSSGVVIAPPLAYWYATAHRTLRVLAEGLAAQGFNVLRVDYDGTGDSAGDQWDPDRLASWNASLVAAADELRTLGSPSVSVVGLHAGALLAMGQGRQMDADRMVLWGTVDGRRLAREIRLLGTEVPESEPPGHHGAVVEAGTVFSAATLEDLELLGPAMLTEGPAPRVLVLDRAEAAPSAALVKRLVGVGTEVDHLLVSGVGEALDQPAEYATVPSQAIDQILRWMGPAPSAKTRRQPPEPRPSAILEAGDGIVREEVITLGPSGLVGILTEPSGAPLATVLWLNPGSESHVGPGRAWVEFARTLARANYASIRLDFSGWGESPDLGRSPGRPYDSHGIAEAVATVEALRTLGHTQVVLSGLCAGAWVALRAALLVPVDGVVAINPQMYWQPGDPVEADLLTETRVRRQEEIDRYAWGAQIGLWAALDHLGTIHPAGQWLDGLDRNRTPVLALFAEGDDGLQFLQDRVGTAWARVLRSGSFELAELRGLDHPMHRHWHRTAVVTTIIDYLDRNVGPLIDLRSECTPTSSESASAGSGPPQHPPGS